MQSFVKTSDLPFDMFSVWNHKSFNGSKFSTNSSLQYSCSTWSCPQLSTSFMGNPPSSLTAVCRADAPHPIVTLRAGCNSPSTGSCVSQIDVYASYFAAIHLLHNNDDVVVEISHYYHKIATKNLKLFSAGKIQCMLLCLFKFDIRVGVNAAGIHYRMNSIWIYSLLLKALGGALIQIPKKLKMIFIQF